MKNKQPTGRKSPRFIDRVGEIHKTNEGEKFTIVECFGSYNCTIEFENGFRIYNLRYDTIKNSQIKNPYYPSVYGIGFIGQGKHKVSIKSKLTPVYEYWSGILKRCYSINSHLKHPTYKNCSVDEYWHNFQNFGDWFEKNFNPDYMQNWHLDKDILIKGNKVYSLQTCAFVPREINNLFIKREKVRGDLPIGVSRKGNSFIVQVMIEGNKIHVGSYKTKEEAFNAYKITKERYIKKVADKWRSFIEEKAYIAMYNYKVEITD